MSRSYYYFVAGLPDLFLDQERKDFNLIKLKEEAKECLHPADYELVELLFTTYDNENILNHLLNRKLEFSPLGKFPPELYEEFEDNLNKFPQYVIDFYNLLKGNLDESDDEGERNFDSEKVDKNPEVQFYELFFSSISNQKNRFIVEWFKFLQDTQNILAAQNCRNLGRDIQNQLVGNSPLVESLSRSQAPDFGLKMEVDYIDNLLNIAAINDPLDRERRLDLFRWEMADNITLWDYFTIEKVLAFFVKAGIVQRWIKLDPKVGQEMFEKFLYELRQTYTMPKEFS